MDKVYCFLAAAALFAILFNYRDDAQHIGIPLLLMVEKVYCFLTAAALFPFFSTTGVRLNTQAFIQSTLFDILYQLQGCYGIKSLRIYAFPTIIAGAGN